MLPKQLQKFQILFTQTVVLLIKYLIFVGGVAPTSIPYIFAAQIQFTNFKPKWHNSTNALALIHKGIDIHACSYGSKQNNIPFLYMMLLQLSFY